MISTYIDQFFSGSVHPATPHLVLILASVAGAIAVGVGIIWEAKRSGHLYTLPTAFVFFGVIIEACATVILFEFDEGISRSQQSTIAQLETPRSLSESQKHRIATVAGLHRLSFVIYTAPEAEPWNLALEFGKILKENGWTWLPCPGLQPLDGRPAECTSILDHIEVNAPSDLRPVADALIEAIKDPEILGMDRVWSDQNAKPSVITIIVGSKR